MVGHLSGRASQAGALEQDDLAAPGERVGDGRVPVVQGPGEVLQEDERRAGASSEPAVGVCLEPGLDELRGCGDGGRVAGHRRATLAGYGRGLCHRLLRNDGCSVFAAPPVAH